MKKSLLSFLLLSAAFVSAADKKNVLLIAGRPSHPAGEHEHNAGIQLLASGLKQGAADLVAVDVSSTANGLPMSASPRPTRS